MEKFRRAPAHFKRPIDCHNTTIIYYFELCQLAGQPAKTHRSKRRRTTIAHPRTRAPGGLIFVKDVVRSRRVAETNAVPMIDSPRVQPERRSSPSLPVSSTLTCAGYTALRRRHQSERLNATFERACSAGARRTAPLSGCQDNSSIVVLSGFIPTSSGPIRPFLCRSCS